jgi:hypothetical protein
VYNAAISETSLPLARGWTPKFQPDSLEPRLDARRGAPSLEGP